MRHKALSKRHRHKTGGKRQDERGKRDAGHRGDRCRTQEERCRT